MSNKVNKRAVVFVRVSTNKQDTTRQESDLKAIAEARGFIVEHVIRETVSGAASLNKRSGLKELLELAESGKIDLVACTEISRLGRSTALVLQTVEQLHDLSVGIYVQQFELWSQKQNGEKNPMSNFFLQLLSSFAELERNTIQERVKSGIANYIDKGGRMGRPEGSKEPAEAFISRHAEVVKYLKRGFTAKEISQLTGKGLSTVSKAKGMLSIKEREQIKVATFEHRNAEAIKVIESGGGYSDLIKMGVSNGTAANILKFVRQK